VRWTTQFSGVNGTHEKIFLHASTLEEPTVFMANMHILTSGGRYWYCFLKISHGAQCRVAVKQRNVPYLPILIEICNVQILLKTIGSFDHRRRRKKNTLVEL
jgi:hypothetical protein